MTRLEAKQIMQSLSKAVYELASLMNISLNEALTLLMTHSALVGKLNEKVSE